MLKKKQSDEYKELYVSNRKSIQELEQRLRVVEHNVQYTDTDLERLKIVQDLILKHLGKTAIHFSKKAFWSLVDTPGSGEEGEQ